MASQLINLNTWSAKRVIGDESAANISDALLQAKVNGNIWIFGCNRASNYGIKYTYDSAANGTADKIEFHGGNTSARRAYIQLDTGDASFLGKVGIGADYDSSYQLYVNGASSFNGKIDMTGNITISNGSPHLYLQNTSWTKGTTPGSLSYSAVEFITNGSYNNNLRIGIIESNIDTSNNTWLNVWVIPNAAGSTSWSGIRLRKTSADALTIYNQGNTKIEGKLGVNYDPDTSGNTYQLYVDGTGYISSNTTIEGVLTVGKREVTSAPSSLTYSNRITIVPYFHTGGPWYIKSGDDSSNAYLALYYNTTQLMRIKHDGTQMVDWKGNADTASKWQTARTLTIGATGKSVDGSGNVSWSMNEIMGSSDSSKFYRGDKTWSNDLVGSLNLQGNLTFSNSGTAFRGINYGTMGDNDQWRVGGAATASNAGYMEIATADDGTEPIYVRQYTGVFSSLTRTLTLLDGSGHTTLPGRLFIPTDSDVTTNSGTGSIVIGSTSGLSIGIDANEIMCRSSNAASTLYIQNEGGAVQMGAPLSVSSTITASSTIHANGGYLKSTLNGNTLQMGSANATWCHFSSGVKYHFNPDIWAVGGFHVTNAGGSDLGANHTQTECTVNNTNGKIGIYSSTNRGLYEYTDGKWIIYLQHSDDTVRFGYNAYCYSSSVCSGNAATATKFGESSGYYLRYINTTDMTTWTADTLGATTSIAFTRGNVTGAYTTGHIVWLNANDIGTPFQLVVHDSSDLYLYKRWKSSGTWQAWTKMRAGYADSAGSCTGNAATVSRATFGDSSNGEHNANNITSNGLYYYTSNGPATDVNQFKSTDGAIYCQAYSTSWVAQIAQDYRNGSLAVRAKNNGTWQAWLSIPKMKVESYPALLPANGENNWIKVGTSNTSYGLLPSQSGGAGSGHNYLGTSSWYWKYAYVDEIYGHLNGNCTGSSGSCTGNAATATKGTTVNCSRVNKNCNEHPGKNIAWVQEFNPSSANLPSSHWYYIYSAQGDDTTYSVHLALGETTSALYYRVCQGNSWPGWSRIVTNSGSWSISVTGSSGSCTGNAATATSATSATYASSYLASRTTVSGSSHAAALKTYFDNNKSTIPRNCLQTVYSSAYSNGSQYFGYFLNGYDSNPYGGFFVAHYNAAYYVGISNGTYTENRIVFNSGTWSINVTGSSGSCSGLAAKATADGDGNTIKTTYLKLSGGTMTGILTLKGSQYSGPNGAYAMNANNSDIVGANGIFTADNAETFGEGLCFYRSSTTWDSMAASGGTFYFGSNKAYTDGLTGDANISCAKVNCTYIYVAAGGGAEGGEIQLAAAPSYGYTCYLDVYTNLWRVVNGNTPRFWVNLQSGGHSDYAEHRAADSNEPGRVYKEQDSYILTKANKRLTPGCSVLTDTCRMAINGPEKGPPFAVSGCVLCFPYQSRTNYHAGMAVCSAPNGTVDIMTREEIREYPDCILGYVAGIPDEETWNDESIELKGRIWIRLA